MAISTDQKKIDQLLNQGTADVIVKEDLEKKLKSGQQLRIKFGIDPTGFDLHLGHMVAVNKLKQFQDLGHQIVLLFGNFTGQIGDPTGKSETRPPRTQAELETNAKHYLDQVKHILDIKKVEVVWNADWLAPLKFADIIQLASNFTVAQMLERDMFQERIKNNQPISMHEFFYPLMQGYDSVPIKADVEIGGTDQTFNLLAGRTLQKAYDQTPQNILTVPILEGTDGKKKMGKSDGNYIAVADSPKDMYGKTMSIPDSLIIKYFQLATHKSVDEIETLQQRLNDNENPMNLKKELAHTIVSIYHSQTDANKAAEEFTNIFKNKGLPDNIETITIAESELGIIDLIAQSGLTSSKSEARRMIQGGGVRIDGDKIEDIELQIEPTTKKRLLQIGKRRFIYFQKD